MRLISFTRGLLDNLGVKLIALVVALVIWFNASGQQETNRTVIASLNFVNVPDTLTITGGAPPNVELSVSGTRRELLLLGFRRVEMLINLSRAQPGRYTQRLSVSDLLLPPGIEPGDVRVLSPVSLNINIERLLSRRVRVGMVTRQNLPGHLILRRPLQPRPGWVRVTGAESAVARLEEVPTQPIDLSRVRESGTRDVALDYNASRLLVVPDRIVVAMEVTERAERVLGNLPPTVLNDRSGYVTAVTPSMVTLALEGPRSLLDTLSSRDVSILVDVSRKRPGRYVLAPDVIVPDGVVRYALDVDSLLVDVRRSTPDS